MATKAEIQREILTLQKALFAKQQELRQMEFDERIAVLDSQIAASK